MRLAYDDEIRLKDAALQRFWSANLKGGQLAPLVRSPLGRAYRTITKRKTYQSKTGTVLGLIDPSRDGADRSFQVIRCAIEPDDHAKVYVKIQESLAKPYGWTLGEHLNYVIVKGNYQEFAVIFNVSSLLPPVVHAANTLSKSLTHTFKNVTGVFLYEDDSDGRYYLGARNTRMRQSVRKLYGKGELSQRVAERSFLFSPLSFSQVNLSLVPAIVEKAGALLQLSKESKLFDLYCGYGLFSLCLAEQSRAVVGVELSHQSVQSAIANAKRQRVSNARFIRSEITGESLLSLLQNAVPDDVAILDPPRNGTAPGVIEEIAEHRLHRILHLFCNIDLMPGELDRWKRAGYAMETAIPFDMFPGTADVEVMVLLKPS